jgi:hypothetical protein
LEEVLPEISIFCKMFLKYQEQLFVAVQLLEILKLLDFSDEAGRRALSILLSNHPYYKRYLLVTGNAVSKTVLPESVMRSMLDILMVIHKDVEFTR